MGSLGRKLGKSGFGRLGGAKHDAEPYIHAEVRYKGPYCESRLGDGSRIRLQAFYWLIGSKTARIHLRGPICLTFCTQELMVGRQEYSSQHGKNVEKRYH